MKRLKKHKETLTWNTREVFRQKGYTEEETEIYLTAMPNRDPIHVMQDAQDL
jgi:hypothetical protein